VHGGRYLRNATTSVDFTCGDASPDVQCTGTTADGAAIPTGTTGAKRFSVTATDVAGNVAARLASYKVFDPVNFTARFTEQDVQNIATAAAYWKVAPEDLPATGVAVLRYFLALNPDAEVEPISPAPANDGSVEYRSPYLPDDSVRVVIDAARCNLDGDQLQ
jgi:hypothetical protein